jgi:hypothetical protein
LEGVSPRPMRGPCQAAEARNVPEDRRSAMKQGDACYAPRRNRHACQRNRYGRGVTAERWERAPSSGGSTPRSRRDRLVAVRAGFEESVSPFEDSGSGREGSVSGFPPAAQPSRTPSPRRAGVPAPGSPPRLPRGIGARRWKTG